jgi:hypothetical protein
MAKVAGYQAPASVEGLFINDEQQLVVAYGVHRSDGTASTHFWNGGTRQDLTTIDPARFSYDRAAHEAVPHERPNGGFYVTLMGLLYIIGFTDDGQTNFFNEKRPIALFSEADIAAVCRAMAEGQLLPQAALDSLTPSEP